MLPAGPNIRLKKRLMQGFGYRIGARFTVFLKGLQYCSSSFSSTYTAGGTPVPAMKYFYYISIDYIKPDNYTKTTFKKYEGLTVRKSNGDEMLGCFSCSFTAGTVSLSGVLMHLLPKRIYCTSHGF